MPTASDTIGRKRPRDVRLYARASATMRGLEKLDWITVRIEDLDLLACGPGFHCIAKYRSGFAHRFDDRGQVGNPKDDAIGAAGTLPTAIGQDPRSRRARAAQMDLQRAQRDRRERRKLLKFELETQARRIELERPFHVIDQVPDTVEFHGGVGHRGIGSGGFGRGIHHVTPL